MLSLSKHKQQHPISTRAVRAEPVEAQTTTPDKDLTMQTEKIERRGGPNRGQGRKPLPPEKVRVLTSITLPLHLKDWLSQQKESQSLIIEKALESYILREESLFKKSKS